MDAGRSKDGRFRSALLAALLVPAVAVAAAATAGPGFTPYGFILYAHVLLFVFWLGADLGVVLSARAAIQPGLTAADRLNAAWLMSAIDVGPRVAASLMLTIGGLLTEYVGIPHPAWQWAGIVLLGPVWLSLVLVGWFRRGSSLADAVDRAELLLRGVLIPAVGISVAWSWWTGRLDPAPYVGAKLLIFMALLWIGFGIRQRLGPFRAGLRALESRGALASAEEAAMAASVRRTRPLVFTSWIALLLAAWLGVSRPGQQEVLEPAASDPAVAGGMAAGPTPGTTELPVSLPADP